jgi:hypothetical protein
LNECRRLLSGERGHRWETLKGDRRSVDEHGDPTEEFRSIVEAAGADQFRKLAHESYLNCGITCFGERPDLTLLWSHYGGGHRGFCLEFDTTSPILSRLHKVRYTDKAPVVNLVVELLGGGQGILPCLLTKASCWSDEQEWRAIHKQADTEYGYGLYTLTGVYLGAQLTPAERDLLCHMLHGSPTQLYEVRRAEGSLALEVRAVTYSPY